MPYAGTEKGMQDVTLRRSPFLIINRLRYKTVG